MMTDVVVVPSLEGILVGCVLLTGTVLVTVTDTKVWGGEVVSSLEGLLVDGMLLLTGTVLVVVTVRTVWGKVVCSGINAVETQGTKQKMCYIYSVRKQEKTL